MSVTSELNPIYLMITYILAYIHPYYILWLCSFARRNGYDWVIAVESEETDWFDIRNPSLHACYGGYG